MTEGNSLLAYLILELNLTNQYEVAATRSLAYILDNSPLATKGVLNLVNSSIEGQVEPIRRVVAESTTRTGDGRVDFLCYDSRNGKRIVGEAKFDAPISPGQGGRYLLELEKGDSVLLFVVPDYRISKLWGDVRKDIELTGDGVALGNTKIHNSIRCAKILCGENNWHLMMVSWHRILQEMNDFAEGDTSTQSNIHQLKGLTLRMDKADVFPFEAEEISSNVGRRMSNLRRIFDDVRQGCHEENGIVWGRPNADLQSGYGNFCYLSNSYAWFGVYYDLWAREDCASEPFWVALYHANQDAADAVSRKLGTRLVRDNWGRNCVSIDLMLGEERTKVVDSMILKLGKICEAISENGPSLQDSVESEP